MKEQHQVTGFSGPDHRVRRPGVRVGAVAGATAAVVAAGLGTAMLLTMPSPGPFGGPSPGGSSGPTAERITASASVSLSRNAILGLLSQRPDLGPLGDATRRGSCLNGLGYPASTAVLGAQQVNVGGHAAVLLVVAGDTPQELHALVVPQSCSSANTGLIADTQLPGP
ncbi:MAG TPA: hypothetical protein VMU34_19490 [Mycobacterium sp.]|nr:hypothetical protein [Mycobacterium sp.]